MDVLPFQHSVNNFRLAVNQAVGVTTLEGSWVKLIVCQVEFASRERDESKPGIKTPPGGGDSHMKQTGMLVVSLRGVTLLPFLKNITEESDLETFKISY